MARAKTGLLGEKLVEVEEKISDLRHITASEKAFGEDPKITERPRFEEGPNRTGLIMLISQYELARSQEV